MLRVQLNDIQRYELRLLARREIGRVSERIHFVLLSDGGRSAPEIGELLGYDEATVRRMLKRYEAQGVAGLHDEPRLGRPRREVHLNDVVETQVGQPPTVYGYVQTIWTVALLVLHLTERFHLSTSVTGVRRALHQIGFSWHRPKLSPARRPDPDRAAKEARLSAVLADPDATVVAIDECDVHLLAIVRAMWQRVGQQLRLPTPGVNRRRSIFGGFNLRTGAWHYALTDHKRSTDFIAFLTQLLDTYAHAPIYVVADNASLHTSRAVAVWLAAHPRLQIVFLPTYSGHRLNPVEKVWWQLKAFIAANRNFHSLLELDAAIQRSFETFTPPTLFQLTNCHIVRHARSTLSSNLDISFAQ